MRQYKGKRVADGAAVDRVKQIREAKLVVEKRTIEDAENEIARFLDACRLAQKDLEKLVQIAREKLGEMDTEVFDGWLLMLADETLLNMVRQLIKQEQVNAEYALSRVMNQYIEAMSGSDDYYLRERAADIREVEERILANLLHQSRENLNIENPCILVSEEITPEQMIRLDRDKIRAFVMAGGSVRSHAAVMARIMGIPAVVSAGMPVLDIPDGELAAVDGYLGIVYTEPGEDIIRQLEQKAAEEKKHQKKLRALVGTKTVTKGGKNISIYANISSGDELNQVLANDGAGVGLFRSEWLYLERSSYPSEEMQFIVYSRVLKKMGGRRVVIRTLDVGGDKKADYMQIRREDNPVLGLRGIRFCMEYPDIFKTQLRALYRSSIYGSLSIIFPMIISVEEIREIKQTLVQVQEELRREGYSFQNVPIGVMIETPAAALISDQLAKEVDFFSIGTNDLIQYTLAVDRQNPDMEKYYTDTHAAVLRLIAMTVRHAGEQGIPVSVCGELGGNLSVTQKLLDMGITRFSVNPPQMLVLKEKILDCQ